MSGDHMDYENRGDIERHLSQEQADKAWTAAFTLHTAFSAFEQDPSGKNFDEFKSARLGWNSSAETIWHTIQTVGNTTIRECYFKELRDNWSEMFRPLHYYTVRPQSQFEVKSVSMSVVTTEENTMYAITTVRTIKGYVGQIHANPLGKSTPIIVWESEPFLEGLTLSTNDDMTAEKLAREAAEEKLTEVVMLQFAE